MKNKKFLTQALLSVATVFLFTPVRAQDPPPLFQYNISTAEAFYFVQFASIDGITLDSNDWIGAFNGDVCVGSVQWAGEFTEVPVMGDDGDFNSDGYMLPGEFPDFMIYDASDNQFYNAEPSENFGWANFEFFFITNLNAIIPDCFGTPGGTAFYDDCGQCVGGETGQPENWAMDDCGVCFGYNNDMDCNGDCFGLAYFDDCGICSDGNTGHLPNSDMDCADECFGVHITDENETCCLAAEQDYCGLCFGDKQCPGNGDVNGDGSLDVLDAVRLISIIMLQITPTDYELWTADLIWDGSVDVLDAVNLISLIMGG
ncbi:MAG: dockerin type I repeat-containing protein [Flavobacteriales bacterium]